jgi:hypothetical protein
MKTATKPAPSKPKKVRFYVTLSKRGRKVALTLNGGVMFKDASLAFRGARGALKRDGWKRAVIEELWFITETTWEVAGRLTITVPTVGGSL